MTPVYLFITAARATNYRWKPTAADDMAGCFGMD
jgi:hypothetical protein